MPDNEVRERALARHRAAENRGRDNLLEYIPFITPEFAPPVHLAPMCDLYDRIQRGESVFACVEAPPRHGKSEVLFHGSARLLRFKPQTRIGYVTYSQDVADDQSRIARRRALAAGVEFGGPLRQGGRRWDPSASVRHWQTAAGGGFLAIGRDGGLVSKGLDLLQVDDPFKNRAEAESAAIRDLVWNSFRGDQLTRLEPGASCIVFHQRWNNDDLIARLRKLVEEEPNAPPWEFVSLPAIGDDGTPLWPERFDLAALARIRAMVNEYNWWSQYMQRPRPKGGRVFGEPTRYEPPAQLIGRRIVIAVDAAGTAKTSADHTAIVVAAFWRATWTSPEGLVLPNMLFGDLLRCYRMQLEVPDVVRVLDVLQRRWPGAPIVVETQGGQGQTVAQTLRRLRPSLRIVEVPRTVDKFTAAQPTAAATTQGRWRVPLRHDPELDSVELEKLLRELDVWDEGEWIGPYLRELERFTGIADAEDDQVDATCHAWDYGDKAGAPPKKPALGPRAAANSGGY